MRRRLMYGWPVTNDDGGLGYIQMEEAAREAIVQLCRGEPFLFQLAGERAWYAGTGPVITVGDVWEGWAAARYEAAAHVERILNRLPGRELQLLEAMASMSPEDRTATKIARAMGFTGAPQAGPTAQRLDTIRGIIDRGPRYKFRHRAVEAYLTSDWPNLQHVE